MCGRQAASDLEVRGLLEDGTRELRPKGEAIFVGEVGFTLNTTVSQPMATTALNLDYKDFPGVQ